MRFDKQADARAIQDAKRDVDLIKFAGDLGYQVEEKKTRIKYLSSQISAGEAAVMVSGSKQIDVFRGENGEWAWYDRKEGRGGDVFKLYQRENPEKSFAQAKEAVIGDRAPLSEATALSASIRLPLLPRTSWKSVKPRSKPAPKRPSAAWA